MTPKQKAQELYNKIDNLIYYDSNHFIGEEGIKNVAIYCIDEIIASCEYNLVENHNTDWWNKVKEELIKY